jgi:hypothetical protein
MAKSKDVSTEDCLEIMRRFEAVEITMKKLEGPSDTHVDASYTRDPTKKSQRNGFKNRQSCRPRPEPDSMQQVKWKETLHLVQPRHPSPQQVFSLKDSTCKFWVKQGHFERACLKKSKRQHAVDVVSDQDSSE